MPFKARPAIDRFHEYYTVNEKTGCWEWNKARNTQGYGQFTATRDYPTKMAHRWSYIHFKGEIPKGQYVCHKCDNPPCVNPDHLFMGTSHDNMIDATSKQRLWQNKLTHCPAGHPYSGKNLAVYKQGPKSGGKFFRACRECHKLQARERNRRVRAKGNSGRANSQVKESE